MDNNQIREIMFLAITAMIDYEKSDEENSHAFAQVMAYSQCLRVLEVKHAGLFAGINKNWGSEEIWSRIDLYTV